MWRRMRVGLGVAATVALTVLIRAPAVSSSRNIDFDEGVYGASVLAMRAGFVPFRDVFSSQGPLFLPILWLFDVAGLRTFRAVRLGMVLVAVATTLGVYVIARRATGEGGVFLSLLAAAVVGTSAAGIEAAGVIHSDGIALAFGVWAIAVALGTGPLGRWRPAVAGALVGAGMAVKSGFLLPAALAVAAHYGLRREWRHLATAAGSSALLGLVVSVPWGLADVWDQFVAFQLEAPRERAVVPNVLNSVARMYRWDLIFLFMAGVGLAGLAVRLAQRRWPPGDRAVHVVVLVWLAASLALLGFGVELDRGSYRFLVFLVAPAMVALAALRPARWLTVIAGVAAVALLPVHLDGADRLLDVQRLTDTHREVVARLEALPAGTMVVTDNPGLAWVAGRYPPPKLVDPSWARIRAGYLTADQVRAGAARADVCAVLFYTNRFDFLDRNLDASLAGYRLAEDWGEARRLYVKEDCRAVSSPLGGGAGEAGGGG